MYQRSEDFWGVFSSCWVEDSNTNHTVSILQTKNYEACIYLQQMLLAQLLYSSSTGSNADELSRDSVHSLGCLCLHPCHRGGRIVAASLPVAYIYGVCAIYSAFLSHRNRVVRSFLCPRGAGLSGFHFECHAAKQQSKFTRHNASEHVHRRSCRGYALYVFCLTCLSVYLFPSSGWAKVQHF